jgi:hypothetical protein
MNALGAAILAVLLGVILAGTRRLALLAMLAGVLYTNSSQQITVAGLNLFALRFLELAGFARVLARREFSFSRLAKIDRLLVLLYAYTAVVYCLYESSGQAFVAGQAVDACLCYFTFRGLIQGVEDFRWCLRAFVVLLAPYAVLVVIESVTRHNPFVQAGAIAIGEAWERGGRVRCLGTFQHPSLLGTLGASFLPLYIGLAFAPRDRRLALVGAVLCGVIIVAANSGGPVSACAAGLVGWLLWPWRTRMRRVRWALVGLILLAAVFLKAPLWYLPAKVSAFSGGGGWHRSYLMQVAFQHLDRWWLAGMPRSETDTWFPYSLASIDSADITNQFLGFGLNGGLVAVALFILLLARAFGNVGQALASLRPNPGASRETEALLWGLGVVLAVHIATWFGIPYFDQTYALWFFHLAAITAVSQQTLQATALAAGPDALALDPGAAFEPEPQLDQKL